jgi:eukaryotic-like serine/threonine-protein kinase
VEGVLAQRYQLETVVGSGGMGTVWRAHDMLLDRQVAIKEVRYSAQLTDAERQEQTAKAVTEARHAARLGHPRIVPIYDVLIQPEEEAMSTTQQTSSVSSTAGSLRSGGSSTSSRR